MVLKEGYQITQISPASGKGNENSKELIKKRLTDSGVPISGILWKREGPDIVATNETIIWRVECKGLGIKETKSSNTYRNHFDRALSSVVSYYDYDVEGKELRLALAIPYNKDYKRLIERRVKKSLREHLNLWILLFISGKLKLVLPFSPSSDFSYETIIFSIPENYNRR